MVKVAAELVRSLDQVAEIDAQIPEAGLGEQLGMIQVVDESLDQTPKEGGDWALKLVSGTLATAAATGAVVSGAGAASATPERVNASYSLFAPETPHTSAPQARESTPTVQHKVREDETVWDDAEAVDAQGVGHSVQADVQEIETINDMYHPSSELEAGMVIKLPALPHQKGEIRNYKVQPGDTLNGLAKKWHVDLHQVLAINPQFRNDPNLIYPGQEVHKPVQHHHDTKPKKHVFESETVETGDTFSELLIQVHTQPTEKNVDISAKASGVKDANRIFPGEHVKVLLTGQAAKNGFERKHAPKADPKQRPTHETPRHGESPKPNHEPPHHDPKRRDNTHEHHARKANVITVHDVKKILPNASHETIEHNLPLLIAALKEQGIDDSQMVAYSLGTINAETSSFKPIPEYGSGAEYNNRPDLGNIYPGDGELFKGRGFIQLTGRSNYRIMGHKIGVDLESNPELALEPKIAAKIFAVFIAERKEHIRDALNQGDLATARSYVNGGTNGLQAFSEAYNTATAVLPQNINAPVVVQASAGGPSSATTPSAESIGEQIADDQLAEEHEWESNNYNAPDGQSGPDMYHVLPTELDGAWCDEEDTEEIEEAYAKVVPQADIPLPNDPIALERVSQFWQDGENHIDGWSAHTVASGAMPQIGDSTVHQYPGSDKPDHINTVTAIRGNRMQLTGGDQINPRIGHWDTINDSAVTSYWVDIPTVDSPNPDSIVGYLRPPAPETPATQAPPAETTPTSTPQPTDPSTVTPAPTSAPVPGPAIAPGVTRY